MNPTPLNLGDNAPDSKQLHWDAWLEARDAALAWRRQKTGRHVSVVVSTEVDIDHPQLSTLCEADQVVIEIGSFRDGRMFGLARLIRHRLKFDGELKVAGDYLPDQVCFLERCGVDSFARSCDGAPDYYSAYYQPGAHRKNGRGGSIRRARMEQDSKV